MMFFTKCNFLEHLRSDIDMLLLHGTLLWYSYHITLAERKKNLQELAGVYVYNVTEREQLDRPDARLIKEFSCVEGNAT